MPSYTCMNSINLHSLYNTVCMGYVYTCIKYTVHKNCTVVHVRTGRSSFALGKMVERQTSFERNLGSREKYCDLLIPRGECSDVK